VTANPGQVSTSGALVAGVYDREVSVQAILEHGNFGLGTFADLDGEMVILDGRVYQVQGSGRVSEAAADAGAPFAVVTAFEPEIESSIGPISSFRHLEEHCDRFRRSGNIFYAFRLDGHFRRVRTRAVSPPEPGTRLVDAAKVQSEFNFADIDGTLVGLWSPGFSSAFSVAGYHFHFLSADRRRKNRPDLYPEPLFGDNPALTFLTVLGGEPPADVTINEMTTVASVWDQ